MAGQTEDELAGELRVVVEHLQDAQEMLKAIANKRDAFFEARTSAGNAADHVAVAINEAATALGLVLVHRF